MYQGLDNRNKHMQERRQADMKDFFVKYFKEMQQTFELRRVAYDNAMDKVSKYLEAKQ